MATRLELLDTRAWYPAVRSSAGRGASPAPEIECEFLDLVGGVCWVSRRVLLDCLPAVFTRLDARGDRGYIQRRWALELTVGGPVYRERKPVPYKPEAYQARVGNPKGGRPRAKDPEPVSNDDEGWT